MFSGFLLFYNNMFADFSLKAVKYSAAADMRLLTSLP
jgi:hypothetical protein